MGLRVIVVTLLLGFSLGLQTSGGQPVRMSYGLIGCSYLITVPYLWILPRLRNERWIAGLSYSQIAIDLLLETVLIAKTGGVESPFVVLYVITVSLASLVPGQRVAQVTGTSAVLLFATLVFSQLGEVGAASDWTAPTKMATHEALWTFGVNGLAVLLVGLLSGALAEQLREGGRLVAVVNPGRTVGQAVLAVRRGGVLAQRILFDAATRPLPEFAREPGFVF